MIKRKDPSPRMTYLFLIVLTRCLILSCLWKQGDLPPQTASVALTFNALFYINLRLIQNFFRAEWGREYEEKLAFLNTKLTRDDLTSKEREFSRNCCPQSRLINELSGVRDDYWLRC
ncbi:hypothetical protein D3C84_649900 [compost metagenome]